MTRYGPAGIFSTDNPVSDAMQIAAEEGPPEEDYEDWLFGDDDPVAVPLFGSCRCGWQGSGQYWEGDQADFQRAYDALCEAHSREAPECGLTPAIG